MMKGEIRMTKVAATRSTNDEGVGQFVLFW
jgi:hypothetical protein